MRSERTTRTSPRPQTPEIEPRSRGASGVMLYRLAAIVTSSLALACAGNPIEANPDSNGIDGTMTVATSSSDDPSPSDESSSTSDATATTTTTDDVGPGTDPSPTSSGDATTRAPDSTGDASTEDSGGAPVTTPVSLGMAGSYAILTQTGIASVPPTAITGDIGVSPAAATYITGFSLSADATNIFSTSAQVTGNVYAADYAVPTPANMTTAVLDMGIAITDAASRTPDVLELGDGDIGGMFLDPGVYNWSTSVSIPTDLTLDGEATDVWIFQIAQDLTLSDETSVLLNGSALPDNVFWQVAGLVDIGATAQFEGVVLTQSAVRLRTAASLHGRVLTQTAVTLDGNTLVEAP